MQKIQVFSKNLLTLVGLCGIISPLIRKEDEKATFSEVAILS